MLSEDALVPLDDEHAPDECDASISLSTTHSRPVSTALDGGRISVTQKAEVSVRVASR